MSSKRKPNKQGHPPLTADGLRPRVERAVAENRYQQALELAKQLYKYEPTPNNLELLKKTYLGRARQLRGSGYDRDAATTLEAAVRIDPANPVWLEQVASEMAISGAGHKALELLKQVPSSPSSSSISAVVLARAADSAIQQEAAGKAQLPAEWHAEFDRILLAFKQVETGQDDAAKETLQGIGLKSPFLEWKLFLRGLQAYYQNDDARALENWSRLDAERLPARLAAPFRSHLDSAFRTNQPIETQTALKTQYDRLQTSLLADQLRRLRAALADTEARNLTNAFRQVEALLPAMRLEAPQLLPRLAACCYWAVLETGSDDAQRYKRVFGAPTDDPNFHRIEALASERMDEFGLAHRAWQDYEKEIRDAPPTVWPPTLSARARALIWLRMGKNAAMVPSAKSLAMMPRHLRDMTDWPEPLNPTGEQCLDRCIALAPELLDAYEALYQYHEHENRPAQAEKVARKLLERFPDHVPTLTALGHKLHLEQNYPAALELYQRALKANPLDRKHRASISVAHLGCARLLIEAGRCDEARPHLQSAEAFNDNTEDSRILCRWAALEFKAGNPDAAEDRLRAARERTPDLTVSFIMLTECVRIKLDKKVKARFDREVKAGFAAPSVPAAIAHLVSFAASLKRGGVTYYGQKTHEKKIQTMADQSRNLEFTERQLVEVITGLMGMDAWKPAQRCAEAGERKFRNNPEFPVLLAAMQLRPDKGRNINLYQVRPALARAEKLIRDLPKEDERKERLTQQIATLQQSAQLLDPWSGFGSGLSNLFGSFGPDDYDDDDDDDFDDL